MAVTRRALLIIVLTASGLAKPSALMQPQSVQEAMQATSCSDHQVFVAQEQPAATKICPDFAISATQAVLTRPDGPRLIQQSAINKGVDKDHNASKPPLYGLRQSVGIDDCNQIMMHKAV